MRIRNARLWNKPGLHHVTIDGERISHISEESGMDDGEGVDIGGAWLLPGFVNAHDHLDFNNYPMFGHGPYQNYVQWGRSIQQGYKEEIEKVRSIPAELRIQWGIYKNLLNGFTTVFNHGARVRLENDLLDIRQDLPALHSVSFEKGWKKKLLNLFRRGPFIMHLGEGVDDLSRNEISQVIRANWLRRRIIAVHGVAMTAKQARHFHALTWCPASNFFLFRKTADIASLGSVLPIVFGTDSTLTSPWNAWEHFRQAMNAGLVDENQLMEMLTARPRRLFGLDGGTIESGGEANFIVVGRERIFDANPPDVLMSFHRGNALLADESLLPLIAQSSSFSIIEMNGRTRWVRGDLPGLTRQIRKYYPEAAIPFSIPGDG